MEHYEGHSNSVKEKSVYLLHLDTPRIILIASVIIGVIAATFLFGINFPGKSSNSSSFKGDIAFNDNDRFSFYEDNSLPPAPGSEDIDEKISDEKNNSPDFERETPRSSDSDILTAENIKEIIQPGKKGSSGSASASAEVEKKPEPSRESASPPVAKVQTKQQTEKKPAPAPAKQAEKKSTEQQDRKVVEVAAPSSKEIEERAVRAGSFSIQVAAYDSRENAEKEAEELRSLRYDSYIDRTSVDGKTYFRVRIGPITSRDTAMSLLYEVQDNPRYHNAYIIRE